MYYLLVQLIFLILVQKCPYDIYICIFHITHACTKLRFQFNLHTLSAWSNGWCQGGWLCRVDMGWRCIKRATALRTDRLTPVDDPCSFSLSLQCCMRGKYRVGGSKCRNIRFSLPKQKSCSAAYFLSWQQFSVGREIHWKVTKPQLMFHPFETIVGYD